MIRPKLGFRNRSVPEQLRICQRVIASLERAPTEKLVNVSLPEASAAVAAAQASHDRVLQLKAALRSETTNRNALLRVARDKVRASHGLHALNLNNQPAQMLAAGMDLTTTNRSVGKPAAPANLRARPDAHEGAVRLRWERPLRRCLFEVQARLDGASETDWKSHQHCLRQSCVVKELVSGGKYWFRVRANNAHGPGPWSNAVSARVR